MLAHSISVHAYLDVLSRHECVIRGIWGNADRAARADCPCLGKQQLAAGGCVPMHLDKHAASLVCVQRGYVNSAYAK